MFSQIDRQLFARWRRSALGQGKPGARVAVVGNCQSFAYSYGMKLFNPSLQIDRYAVDSGGNLWEKPSTDQRP